MAKTTWIDPSDAVTVKTGWQDPSDSVTISAPTGGAGGSWSEPTLLGRAESWLSNLVHPQTGAVGEAVAPAAGFNKDMLEGVKGAISFPTAVFNAGAKIASGGRAKPLKAPFSDVLQRGIDYEQGVIDSTGNRALADVGGFASQLMQIAATGKVPGATMFDEALAANKADTAIMKAIKAAAHGTRSGLFYETIRNHNPAAAYQWGLVTGGGSLLGSAAKAAGKGFADAVGAVTTPGPRIPDVFVPTPGEVTGTGIAPTQPTFEVAATPRPEMNMNPYATAEGDFVPFRPVDRNPVPAFMRPDQSFYDTIQNAGKQDAQIPEFMQMSQADRNLFVKPNANITFEPVNKPTPTEPWTAPEPVQANNPFRPEPDTPANYSRVKTPPEPTEPFEITPTDAPETSAAPTPYETMQDRNNANTGESGAIKIPGVQAVKDFVARVREWGNTGLRRYTSTSANFKPLSNFKEINQVQEQMFGAAEIAQNITKNGHDYRTPDGRHIVDKDLSMYHVYGEVSDPKTGPKTATINKIINPAELAERKAAADGVKGFERVRQMKDIGKVTADISVLDNETKRAVVDAAEQIKKGKPNPLAASGTVRAEQKISLVSLAEDKARADYYDEAYTKSGDPKQPPKNPGLFTGEDWLEKTRKWILGVNDAVEQLRQSAPEAHKAVVDTAKRLVYKSASWMKYGESLGVESAASAKTISKYKNFVPNNRDIQAFVAASGMPEDAQKVVMEKGVRTISGGEPKPLNLGDNIVRNDALMTQYYNKQLWKGTVADGMAQNNLGTIHEIPDFTVNSNADLAFSRWKKFMGTQGVDLNGVDEEFTEKLFKMFREPEVSKDSFVFKRNGKYYEFRLNPESSTRGLDMVDAINSFHPQTPSGAMKAAMFVKNMTTSTVVLTPNFWYRNLTQRDLWDYLIRNPETARGGFVLHTLKAPMTIARAVAHVLGDTPVMKQLIQGGLGHAEFARDVLAWGEPVGSAAKFAEAKPGFVLKMGRYASHPIQTLKMFATMQETIMRVAAALDTLDMENLPAAVKAARSGGIINKFVADIHDVALASTKYAVRSGTTIDTEALRSAVSAGRTVTVDFADTGPMVRAGKGALGALVKASPFAGASGTATYQSWSKVADNPALMAMNVLQGATLPAAGLWLLNHNKERYKAMPTSEKNRTLMISDNIKIAIPGWLGIFTATPQRLLDAAFDKDPKGTRLAVEAAMNSFVPWQTYIAKDTPALPIPLPSPVATILGLWTDVNPAFGSSLNPAYSENELQKNKSWAGTTQASKEISAAVSDVLPNSMTPSPPQIDFASQNIFGDVGRNVLRTVDVLKGAKVTKNDIPFFQNQFMKPYEKSFNSRHISDLFDNFKTTSTESQYEHKTRIHGDPVKWKDMHDTLNDYVASIRELKKAVRNKEKTEEEAGTEANKLAKEANKIYNEWIRKGGSK